MRRMSGATYSRETIAVSAAVAATLEAGRQAHCWQERGILVSVRRAPDLAGCALDNRYELHAMIGEGAFGRVYRGFDRRLARTVAVKVIKPWWAEDEAWVERFQREAQLLHASATQESCRSSTSAMPKRGPTTSQS